MIQPQPTVIEKSNEEQLSPLRFGLCVCALTGWLDKYVDSNRCTFPSVPFNLMTRCNNPHLVLGRRGSLERLRKEVLPEAILEDRADSAGLHVVCGGYVRRLFCKNTVYLFLVHLESL